MIVLDTHAFIWWVADARRLSAAARHAIDTSETIGIAAITPWEVAILVAKKRLELDRDLLIWLKQALTLPRVELIALSPEIAVDASRLPADFPGDPADRLIVATARLVRSPLVTRDDRIRRFDGVRTIWR